MTVSPLVSTEWLADALRDSAEHRHDPDLRVIDLRWYLLDKTRHGRDEYLRGHIPGAIFMDVDRDLAAPFGQGPGRHPLPRLDVFAEAASRAGIGPDTYV